MDDKLYSYFQPSFVDFYDVMVDTLYGGINSADMQEFCALFEQRRKLKLIEKEEFRTVDLGTGTGRCVVAILQSLGKEVRPSDRDLRFLGVDNSEVMIFRAREKLQKLKAEKELPDVEFKVDSLEKWDAPEWHEGVDFIIAAAGPFHHLLSEDALTMALKQIHLHLKGNGEGLAIINLLTLDELCHREVADSEGAALTEEAFKVGPYRRWRTHHELSLVEGARVMHEKFRLTRVDSDEKVEWEESEEWTLREVDQGRLIQLAAQVGLDQAAIDTPCRNCLTFCRK